MFRHPYGRYRNYVNYAIKHCILFLQIDNRKLLVMIGGEGVVAQLCQKANNVNGVISVFTLAFYESI